jgi:hypothetical protein
MIDQLTREMHHYIYARYSEDILSFLELLFSELQISAVTYT